MTPIEQNMEYMTVLLALCETVRETPGGCPSGVVYAALMSKGVTLEAYEGMLRSLDRLGLVRRDRSHVLRWVGPFIAGGRS